jgi:hypothetical protein
MKELLFAAIFLFQLQSPGQIETGAVAGRLRLGNGTPAAGVRVAAVPVTKEGDKAPASMLEGISQTDASGNYRLEGLPPGRYYIFAGLIDYPNYYPGVGALDGATAIVVAPGATTNEIDFSLPRPPASRVSGRLSGPAASNEVALTALVRTGVTLSATADQGGAFVFPQVSPGRYRLTSLGPGSVPVEVSVTDRDVEGVVLPVVNCLAGFQVRGQLVGAPSAPVRSVELRGTRFGCRTRADVGPDGSFIVENNAADIYSVHLTPSPLGYEMAGIEVDDRNVAVNIRLPVMIELKGRVTVENGGRLPRFSRGDVIRVQASKVRGNESATQPVNDDGSFTLKVFGGNYQVAAPAVPRNYRVKSMFYGAVDLSKDFIQVDGPMSDEIRITLGFEEGFHPGVRISGRVIPPSGGDLAKPGGVLLVSSQGGRDASSWETTLGSDGSFEFVGVESGRYDLQTVPDSPIALREIVVGRTDVKGLEFTLPVLFKINGAIEWRDERGGALTNAPADVSIQFSRKDETNDRSLLVYSSLAQAGAFQAYLPEGDYRFSLSGLPQRFNVRSVAFGAEELLETDLRVRSGLNPMNIRVTLRDR